MTKREGKYNMNNRRCQRWLLMVVESDKNKNIQVWCHIRVWKQIWIAQLW